MTTFADHLAAAAYTRRAVLEYVTKKETRYIPTPYAPVDGVKITVIDDSPEYRVAVGPRPFGGFRIREAFNDAQVIIVSGAQKMQHGELATSLLYNSEIKHFCIVLTQDEKHASWGRAAYAASGYDPVLHLVDEFFDASALLGTAIALPRFSKKTFH